MIRRRAHRSSLRLLVSLSLVGACGCGVARRVEEGPPACQRCHGAPPASGAHLLHATPPSPEDVAYGATTVLEDVAPGGAPGYFFGCGQCHPVDPAHHMNGAVEVDLSPAGAPAASLKARNAPDTAYDPLTKTCSGVYCHSSGQATPAYVAATPAWDATPGALGCTGCHANPPRYASGGAGAPDANGHVQLQDGGIEWGHFGGEPGPAHWGGTKHGGDNAMDWGVGQDAAPITCGTCHSETVDPAAAGPSGFYWLDTGGDYDLGGLLGYRCDTCHSGAPGAPAQGAGKVLPLRHVNGRRDVVFDRRTDLTLFDPTWLPSAPNTPTRPYWVTQAYLGLTIPSPQIPDAIFEGGVDGGTMSFYLKSASYDPATKTCSTVACHLLQTEVVWGTPYSSTTTDACTACHGY